MRQTSSLIFGALVVLTFNHVWIYGSHDQPCGIVASLTVNKTRFTRELQTKDLSSKFQNLHLNFGLGDVPREHPGTYPYGQEPDKNAVSWLLGFLGTKPSVPTAPQPEPAGPDVCPPCKCGLTNTQRRIVGGVETKRNQYPWMAQMIHNGKFYCGASVINSGYVMTAAHCVDRFDKDKLVIRIGDHDRSTHTETMIQDFGVVEIYKHRGYSTVNYNNDIALVKLRGTIDFSGSMRPVCLAEPGITYAGTKGVVTGWGAIMESGPTSDTLLEVTVPIMTNTECKNSKYPEKRITENMMCAGYKDGGKDSCQGDSGGPMHVINPTTKVHRIVGIVSWGEGCALPSYPGVYTRVNRYLTWIRINTPGACYCQ